MYGVEMINVRSSTISGTLSQYHVDPIEVNYVDQENEPCISKEDNVKDLWPCITDHLYSKLNCTLPWVAEKENKSGNLCSLPEEHDLYHATIINGMHQNSEYIEKVAKCIPGCNRTEYSAKLAYNGHDPTISDKWKFTMNYVKDKFPVKEQFYIYGIENLIADFGGYLGLLLGYSLLGFYDNLVDFLEFLFTKSKKKHAASSAKLQKK